MLFDSDGYVARAEECRRLAEVTEDIALREQFLSLHHRFLKYARQLEAREQTGSRGSKQREML
jgi:hypothetical protein